MYLQLEQYTIFFFAMLINEIWKFLNKMFILHEFELNWSQALSSMSKRIAKCKHMKYIVYMYVCTRISIYIHISVQQNLPTCQLANNSHLSSWESLSHSNGYSANPLWILNFHICSLVSGECTCLCVCECVCAYACAVYIMARFVVKLKARRRKT